VIALIDYQAGNLTSVKKALATIGAEVVVPNTPDDLAPAAGVIVPGVGHFGATRALDASWIEAILARVGEGRPLLGICLGMQWLFEGSDEAPDVPGLGLLSGQCYRLGTVWRKPDPN
jgi:glutamine amidotransferase